MARQPVIEDPGKITLYVSKKLISAMKDHCKDQKTTVSRRTAELWERELSGTVRHAIEVPPELQRFLQNVAQLDKSDIPTAAVKLLDELMEKYDFSDTRN